MAARKRTLNRLITKDETLEFVDVLQYQIYNQGTAKVRVGISTLEQGGSLSLGNPLYPEDIQKTIEFLGAGTKEVVVYVEQLMADPIQSPGRC